MAFTPQHFTLEQLAEIQQYLKMVAGIQLNQLPNGLVKSLTTLNSGEVIDINFGGLTAPDMGSPFYNTDGANKLFSQLANFSQTSDKIFYITKSSELGAVQTLGDGNDYHVIQNSGIYILGGEIELLNGGVSFASGVDIALLNPFYNLQQRVVMVGIVTGFVDNGDTTVTVQVLGVGTLAVGEKIVISKTANYNGVYEVLAIGVNEFTIISAFNGTETGEFKISDSPGFYIQTGVSQPIFYSDNSNSPNSVYMENITVGQISAADTHQLFGMNATANPLTIECKNINTFNLKEIGEIEGAPANPVNVTLRDNGLTWEELTFRLKDIQNAVIENNSGGRTMAGTNSVIDISGTAQINHIYKNNQLFAPLNSNGYVRIEPTIDQSSYITFDNENIGTNGVDFFNTEISLGNKGLDDKDERVVLTNCNSLGNSTASLTVFEGELLDDPTMKVDYVQLLPNVNVHQFVNFATNAAAPTAVIDSVGSATNNQETIITLATPYTTNLKRGGFINIRINTLISAVADGGGGESILTVGYTTGLVVGQTIQVVNTTNYNGFYVVNALTATTITITAVFAGTDTGNVFASVGDYLITEIIDATNFAVKGAVGDFPPLESGQTFVSRVTTLVVDIDNLRKFDVVCRNIVANEIGNGSAANIYTLVVKITVAQPTNYLISFLSNIDTGPNNTVGQGFFVRPSGGVFNPAFGSFSPILLEPEERQSEGCLCPHFLQPGDEVAFGFVYSNSNNVTLATPSITLVAI